jgi:predicted short-subunit dehydrogenase-like oxidoreductase (DUF2520 family)
MLRSMPEKPTIAIVGAGNLGSALALSLKEAGYGIQAIVARGEGKSLVRAKALARQTGARAVVAAQAVSALVLWLCVPDAEISRAGASLAVAFEGKFALHSSGALTSDELQPFRRKGASVASVHPLMTFVERSRPSLTAVSFAIEGDTAAVRLARRIVCDLGGEPFSIKKEEKSAYHAWGTFASPLLTALLATTELVAQIAGVKKKDVRRRMLPILRQTLENYGKFGPAAGFSGPIIRGDVETVKRHLEVLGSSPTPRIVYLALAMAALEYLPAKDKQLLRRLLNAASQTTPK